MTVRELILELTKFNQKLTVTVFNEESGDYEDVFSVEETEEGEEQVVVINL